MMRLIRDNNDGSMTVLEELRLKELGHDNAQLKQIGVDLTLDNRILRGENQKRGEAVGKPNSGSGLKNLDWSLLLEVRLLVGVIRK